MLGGLCGAVGEMYRWVAPDSTTLVSLYGRKRRASSIVLGGRIGIELWAGLERKLASYNKPPLIEFLCNTIYSDPRSQSSSLHATPFLSINL